LTIEDLPQRMADWIISKNLSPGMFLIFVKIFLLLFGVFIEPVRGLRVQAQRRAPVAVKLALDPIHFAMIMIFKPTMGMVTPSVGGLLFFTSNISEVPMGSLVG
jgi:C4-dicarboxylate transporter, DctM subunit